MGESRVHLELIENFTSILKEKYNGICKENLTSLILDLVKHHKLEVRVAREKNINNVYLNSIYFNTEIKLENDKTLIGFSKHCKTLIDIADEFRRKAIKDLPIIIKGVSVYHLTKDKKNIKRSGDIDLVYSHPSILESILIEMGFRKDGEVTDHEYSQMIKDDQVIDIHKYMPIINYSEDVSKKMSKAINNDNQLFFEYYNNTYSSKLRYAELSKNSLICEELGGLLLPNMKYQFLIISAHIFKNYVYSNFHASSGVVLSELLDAYELFKIIETENDFLMISKLNNEIATSVAFIGFLFLKIFNDDSLYSCLSKSQQKLIFPKNIQWDGSMYFPTQKNEFLFYDLSDYVFGLGVEDTTIEKGDTIHISPDDRKFSSHGVNHIEFISIMKETNTINMSIKLTSTPINIFADAFELTYESEFRGKCRCIFKYINGEVHIDENSDRLEIKINNEDIGYSVSVKNIPLCYNQLLQKKRMGLIIRATRWGNGPLSNIIPVNISI